MERKANIIAITSGKGGVGKSSIAVNLGILFAKRGKRVCLIDGDYGLANINLLLGLPAKKQPSDLFEKGFNPHKAMITTEWGLDILPSASGISQQQPLLAPSSLQVRRLINRIAFDYDVILIDTAAGIGASVQNYLEVADQALLVINSDPTSITDSFGMIKSMRNVQTSYNVLINRVKDNKAAKDIYKRFSVAVKNYIGIEVEFLGYIQEDSFASAAILSQSPLVIYSSNCCASQCYSQIVKSLLARLQRKKTTQKIEKFEEDPQNISGKIKIPEKNSSKNSSADSFQHWLLKMPSLLSAEKPSINELKPLSYKRRKEKFISKLGELCVDSRSVLEPFENMVIGKRIEQDENSERVLKLHPAEADGVKKSRSNINTKRSLSKEKIVRLSDYSDNKVSV